jgi:hypothetical protein
MRPPTLDPTAGERARAIRANPGAVTRITDPMDPRCGEMPLDPRRPRADAQRVVDPTDAQCGQRRD